MTEHKPWTYEFMTHNEVSEDCLYLNVWTGARAAGEGRPVYLYIYGGANTEGSSAVPLYDGEGLAEKGVVVVTANYRLGILGFFAHPELTKEAEYHASGNYALLDLVAALHWIHDNIAAFGGDPAKVTIGGQSAGGANVHSLSQSHYGKAVAADVANTYLPSVEGVAESPGTSLQPFCHFLDGIFGEQFSCFI